VTRIDGSHEGVNPKLESAVPDAVGIAETRKFGEAVSMGVKDGVTLCVRDAVAEGCRATAAVGVGDTAEDADAEGVEDAADSVNGVVVDRVGDVFAGVGETERRDRTSARLNQWVM
jgi:hypothetical protein